MISKAIILLSGGLDSVVALAYSKKHTDYNVELGLTFDYGQRTVEAEIEASKRIAEYYNIKHKIIRLDWLAEITQSKLVTNTSEVQDESLNTLWVPNRNGLFLNIAASFCDSYGYNNILFGANKDEAGVFPDNTEEFRAQISKCFFTSTLIHPQVVAPLINYSKSDIVKIAIEEGVPLEYIKSCYSSNGKHCGECNSCRYLLGALKDNNAQEYINLLF